VGSLGLVPASSVSEHWSSEYVAPSGLLWGEQGPTPQSFPTSFLTLIGGRHTINSDPAMLYKVVCRCPNLTQVAPNLQAHGASEVKIPIPTCRRLWGLHFFPGILRRQQHQYPISDHIVQQCGLSASGVCLVSFWGRVTGLAAIWADRWGPSFYAPHHKHVL